MLYPRLLFTTTVVLAISGCATPTTQSVNVDDELVKEEKARQLEISLRQHVKRESTLRDVAQDILVSGTHICQDSRPYLGIEAAAANDFEESVRETAAELLGVTNHPTIIDIVAESPASNSSLLPGDILLSMDGKTEFPDETLEDFGTMEWIRKVLSEDVTPGEKINLTISRDGQIHNVSIESEVACGYYVELNNQDAINAFADGERIVVTSGMMRFADDSDLAVVVAHETAHNAMGHIDMKRRNATGGLFLDILAAAAGVNTNGAFSKAAARSHSEEFELEADYVGLYLMASAGHPIEDAPYFWRRMAAEKPESTQDHIADTHPTSPERFVAMQRAIEEIENKIARGAPLKPELKQEANHNNTSVSEAQHR